MPVWATQVLDAIGCCNWRPVQVLRLSRFCLLPFLTIRCYMPWIPWKVRLTCCALSIVAGGSFVGASEVSVRPEAVAAIRRPEPPMRVIEPRHGEPGPELLSRIGVVRNPDPTGSRFPAGLTVSGASKHRTILFTFDDGPSQHTTPRLLDLLDELGIKAVFFVTGQSFGNGNPWEREHADIVREIVRRGHTVGSHTETHRQLPLLRNAEIEAEIALSGAKIAWVVGGPPRLIRPPGGAISKRVEELLAAHHYTSVMWAVYPGDLEVHTPEEVVHTFFRVLERRERESGDRGGIVLMHDTKVHSLEALPELVRRLRARNCQLLKKGEELYDIVDDLGYFIPGYQPDEVFEERQAGLRAQARRACGGLASR
jgi:peptidoglycan/xylan/chitin deacetylase (PgdA/CDA1 family)